jgi:dienelactone hydrolase
MKCVVMTIAALTLAGAAAAAQKDVQRKDVDIKSANVMLKGTYFSPGRPGPAMLLLHQCNMDRHAWDTLAADLAGAGIHVLTIDYRGYGESGGEKLTDAAERRISMQQKWPGDVDAAYDYLVAQKGVDKAHVAAGGASCGVTQSSDLATRRHDIKTLVLLSGNASDATRAYIAQTPGLAVFGAASDGDGNAPKAIKEIVEASKNPQSVVKIYTGTEHGAPMFAKNPDLEPMIVSWVKARLTAKTGTD